MTHNQAGNAVETSNLSKRYGTLWALQNCSITVPSGSITALVGANGAGKSTLLKLLSGLNTPSAGKSMVLGNHPAQTADFLADVGYLAQDIPLYTQFAVKDYLAMGAHLNPRWDDTLMRQHIQDLGIPFDQPVGELSGGQRAQVALAMTLAKKPRLLLLDEPVAALDPLARRDFLTVLGQAVAETGLTVVMSSHLLADLEQICDRLIILAGGHVQLCDNIEHVLQTHTLLVGPRQNTTKPHALYNVILETHTARQSTLLVKLNGQKLPDDNNWHASDVTTEDIVLAYMSADRIAKKRASGGIQ